MDKIHSCQLQCRLLKLPNTHTKQNQQKQQQNDIFLPASFAQVFNKMIPNQKKNQNRSSLRKSRTALNRFQNFQNCVTDLEYFEGDENLSNFGDYVILCTSASAPQECEEQIPGHLSLILISFSLFTRINALIMQRLSHNPVAFKADHG